MRQKSAVGEPKSAEKPVFVDAIDITLRAIEDRARLYRNLVVAVNIVLMLSIVLAVLLRQWLFLAGLILLVPLTGGFLFFDSQLVQRWKTGILEMSRLRGLDVASFSKTISGFRHVPPNSLKAMLSMLPASPEGVGQQEPQPTAGVVNGFKIRGRKNEQRILLGTGLFTLALACLVGGAHYRSIPLGLLGGSLAVVVVVFGRR
jgi:hypothetical protein